MVFRGKYCACGEWPVLNFHQISQMTTQDIQPRNLKHFKPNCESLKLELDDFSSPFLQDWYHQVDLFAHKSSPPDLDETWKGSVLKFLSKTGGCCCCQLYGWGIHLLTGNFRVFGNLRFLRILRLWVLSKITNACNQN